MCFAHYQIFSFLLSQDGHGQKQCIYYIVVYFYSHDSILPSPIVERSVQIYFKNQNLQQHRCSPFLVINFSLGLYLILTGAVLFEVVLINEVSIAFMFCISFCRYIIVCYCVCCSSSISIFIVNRLSIILRALNPHCSFSCFVQISSSIGFLNIREYSRPIVGMTAIRLQFLTLFRVPFLFWNYIGIASFFGVSSSFRYW